MKILITAIGSLGDIFPYIGLAQGLRSRGHMVTLGAAEYFRPYVSAAGITFAPLRPDFIAFRKQDLAFSEFALHRMAAGGPGVAGFVEGFTGDIDIRYADVFALARQSDAIVTHPVHLAAVLAARKLKMPWVSTALNSMQLPSRYDPLEWAALVGQAHRLARFPGLARRLWGLRVPIMRRVTARWFNEFEAFVNQQDVRIDGHPLYDWPFAPHGTAAMFSSLLVAPKPDWPSGTYITGHIPYVGETQTCLPAAVEHFMDAGAAPIVFMLGSWSAESVSFFTESAKACQILGQRGILIAPGVKGLDFGPNVLVTGYLPVDAIFARAAIVVHHGGMGTLQHVLRAGKAMVVVPHALDQYPNAWQACRLGTARALRPAHYGGKSAAAALEALLGDAAIPQRAAALAAQIRAEDGVTQACAFIETALGTYK